MPARPMGRGCRAGTVFSVCVAAIEEPHVGLNIDTL